MVIAAACYVVDMLFVRETKHRDIYAAY